MLITQPRQPGQQTRDELAKRDLKEELLEREAKAKAERDKAAGVAPVEEAPALLEHKKDATADERDAKKRKAEEHNLDADDSDSSSSSSESADEEDEEAELMRELEKIKKERAEEAARKAAAEADRRSEGMLHSNPLLNNAAPAPGDAAIKKKWYEETVFRHQAKDDSKKKKRFINDTTRNDFHRRFLDRFVQ